MNLTSIGKIDDILLVKSSDHIYVGLVQLNNTKLQIHFVEFQVQDVTVNGMPE